MLCPICRLDISEMEIDKLMSAPEPLLSKNEISNLVITPELRRLQRQMSKLFQRQLNSGGIIDIEAEDKRYLVITSPTSQDVASPSKAINNRKGDGETNLRDSVNAGKKTSKCSYQTQKYERPSNVTKSKPMLQKSETVLDETNVTNAESLQHETSANKTRIWQRKSDTDITGKKSISTYNKDYSSSRGGKDKRHKYKPRPS